MTKKSSKKMSIAPKIVKSTKPSRQWFGQLSKKKVTKFSDPRSSACLKVHIFWEGHKILRNLHRKFVLCGASQIYGGDFAKFCGLLRIYEIYKGAVSLKTGKDLTLFVHTYIKELPTLDTHMVSFLGTPYL